MTKTCTICSSTFTKPVYCSKVDWEKRQFCSKRCSNSRLKATPDTPISDIKHGLNGYNMYGCRCVDCREAMRQRKRLQRQGISVPKELWGHKEETNPAWKGDDVGYKSIHDWVRRYKAKTGICTHCLENRGTETGHATQWANVDAQYKRNLDDYIELCPSCHKKYDLMYNKDIRTKK